jgi:hypothetical protein
VWQRNHSTGVAVLVRVVIVEVPKFAPMGHSPPMLGRRQIDGGGVRIPPCSDGERAGGSGWGKWSLRGVIQTSTMRSAGKRDTHERPRARERRNDSSLPTGIRTRPVTSDMVAYSRDQPHRRARSTNDQTVTTTRGSWGASHSVPGAGPVPSTGEAAQPPRHLTWACSRQGKPETLGLGENS